MEGINYIPITVGLVYISSIKQNLQFDKCVNYQLQVNIPFVHCAFQDHGLAPKQLIFQADKPAS